ncbi:hypothetical protein ABZ897_24260 [Nonomuraea sp. NPDC046802]|uniref:hypothetical protein n=1 Tax=Nonomuraea sp. NPDC046802 TaxID=3154919 RepID=UPI0033FD5B31
MRVQGPTLVTLYPRPSWAYSVRNKCGYGLNLRVHLLTIGRTTDCKFVGPGGYATYIYYGDDQNWVAQAC